MARSISSLCPAMPHSKCRPTTGRCTLRVAGYGRVCRARRGAAPARERLLALDAAIDQRHLAALRQANALLDGEIAAVLIDSGDDLSALLAERARENPIRDDELLA